MRLEVEVFGVVLRVTLGPEENEYEYGVDRLHADVVHAGDQEDPVFPRLDWGDDEEGRRRGQVGVGERREWPAGGQDHSRPRIGFDIHG